MAGTENFLTDQAGQPSPHFPDEKTEAWTEDRTSPSQTHCQGYHEVWPSPARPPLPFLGLVYTEHQCVPHLVLGSNEGDVCCEKRMEGRRHLPHIAPPSLEGRGDGGEGPLSLCTRPLFADSVPYNRGLSARLAMETGQSCAISSVSGTLLARPPRKEK